MKTFWKIMLPISLIVVVIVLSAYFRCVIENIPFRQSVYDIFATLINELWKFTLNAGSLFSYDISASSWPGKTEGGVRLAIFTPSSSSSKTLAVKNPTIFLSLKA